MLTQIVLSLEVLAAHLAREGDLRALVRALVDHQVVGLGEPSLAELADELALWSHLTTKVRPTIIVINSHHRKHCGRRVCVFACGLRLDGLPSNVCAMKCVCACESVMRVCE